MNSISSPNTYTPSKTPNKLLQVLQDFQHGLLNWRIWLLLGWQDIRLRYRRSNIGPFWITLSMSIMIYSMGFLYGNLFKMELKVYFPYIAAGMITWSFISTVMIESTSGFIEASHYIKQIKLPYSIFILRILTRNIIVFFHNMIAVIPILLYFEVHLGLNLLIIIINLLIIMILTFTYGMIFAALGSRYRDMQAIVASAIQVMFLLTPIMWDIRLLPEKMRYLIQLNPLVQIVDLIRAPLIGLIPSSHTYTVVMISILIGFNIMLLLFYNVKKNIVFWL